MKADDRVPLSAAHNVKVQYIVSDQNDVISDCFEISIVTLSFCFDISVVPLDLYSFPSLLTRDINLTLFHTYSRYSEKLYGHV